MAIVRIPQVDTWVTWPERKKGKVRITALLPINPKASHRARALSLRKLRQMLSRKQGLGGPRKEEETFLLPIELSFRREHLSFVYWRLEMLKCIGEAQVSLKEGNVAEIWQSLRGIAGEEFSHVLEEAPPGHDELQERLWRLHWSIARIHPPLHEPCDQYELLDFWAALMAITLTWYGEAQYSQHHVHEMLQGMRRGDIPVPPVSLLTAEIDRRGQVSYLGLTLRSQHFSSRAKS